MVLYIFIVYYSVDKSWRINYMEIGWYWLGGSECSMGSCTVQHFIYLSLFPPPLSLSLIYLSFWVLPASNARQYHLHTSSIDSPWNISSNYNLWNLRHAPHGFRVIQYHTSTLSLSHTHLHTRSLSLSIPYTNNLYIFFTHTLTIPLFHTATKRPRSDITL